MADAGTPNSNAIATAIDAARLTALYTKHAAGMRRLAFGVMRDRDAAEDAVQVTFAKAVEAAGDVPPEAIKSWLYRVVFHEAVTQKRRSSVNRKALQKLWDGVGNPACESPEAPLVRREIVEQVREALQSLPTHQRHVAQARVYEEKTFSQIAADMGVPLGTVLTHMRRALGKLRQKLKRYG
jgi:RNA polymerase sigma-70 factor (ECF subfamily)